MNLDQLILHESTHRQVQQFAASPMHAVLLVGPDGIGKTALAEALISSVLQIPVEKLAGYPHFLRISPDGLSISIEAIRNLQHFLHLKTIGSQPYRRALVIEHAQALTTEAQNAYLKLLEEPPADTIMVLTANSSRALLPTINSRLQTITVYTPAETQLQAMLAASTKDEAVRRQAYFLSGGLPGLLSALLSDDQEHPLLTSVAQAKHILQKQTFERLALVDGLSKQKETAKNVLDALERVAAAGLFQAAAKGEAARIKQWHRIRKQTVLAQEALSSSANAKLTLTNLFLHL